DFRTRPRRSRTDSPRAVLGARYDPSRFRMTGMIVRRRIAIWSLVTLLGSVGVAQSPAPANTRVTPGELVVDPPTLINLGFEWLIDGDANRNASVAVSYRKAGETAWQTAMPLV